jgi:2-phosphosulfolactate phosphatase
MERGYEDDVDYCYQVDTLPVLPYYTDNRLVLYKDLTPVNKESETPSEPGSPAA